MPLPKPSKMTTKRFKKPKSTNPTISPPPDLPKKPWPAQNQWRIRVVCTDPDATDDSSADEADQPSPSIARKRLIHEICLPLPSSPSPPGSPHRRRTRSRSPSSRQHSLSLCRDLGSSHAGMNSLLDATSLSPPTLYSSSSSSVTEEEFTRFLSEFLPEKDDGSIWDPDFGRLGSQQGRNCVEMLDLELDSEALSWINSMQRLP